MINKGGLKGKKEIFMGIGIIQAGLFPGIWAWNKASTTWFWVITLIPLQGCTTAQKKCKY
tara:strand:+ start:191 stop:370 length:180 start_codon:yes stop_codon:yes gene_type:complete